MSEVRNAEPYTGSPDAERQSAAEAERVALVAVVNALSDDAVYIASRDWFGRVVMGKPILAAAQNERQERAFDELLEAGFVHGDVERGIYGYRSTWQGRRAHPLCLAAITKPEASQ